MHKTAKQYITLALLAALCSESAWAQDPVAPPPEPVPPPATDPDAPESTGTFRPGMPIPEDGVLFITRNSTDRYTVAPAEFYDAPYTTRVEVATVELEKPKSTEKNKLADTFILRAGASVGGTSLILPLVDADGSNRREVRLEILVTDEVSQALQIYLQTTINRLYPETNVTVVVPNSRTAILDGYVDKAQLVGPIETMVQGFLAAAAQVQPSEITVVDSIRVVGAQQVQLKVVFATINRSKIRDLGFNWTWNDLGGGPLVSSLATGLGLSTLAQAGTSLVSSVLTPEANMPFTVSRGTSFFFGGYLRALETNQLGKILAEPVVVTQSGQPAYFNAGQDFPVVLSPGPLAAPQVEFRPIGTNIRFVPFVLGNGRIRLDVRPEVSTFVATIAVPGGGVAPLINQNVVATTVELENGQTLAIAGLINQQRNANVSKIPVLGNLPLVGWAFTNKSYTVTEDELVVLVTPVLIDAMDERPCHLVTRESRDPNDLEYYLGNKIEPPCFEDPYHTALHPHHSGLPKPVPNPSRPWDNYGKPTPEMLYPPVEPIWNIMGAEPTAIRPSANTGSSVIAPAETVVAPSETVIEEKHLDATQKEEKSNEVSTTALPLTSVVPMAGPDFLPAPPPVMEKPATLEAKPVSDTRKVGKIVATKRRSVTVPATSTSGPSDGDAWESAK